MSAQQNRVFADKPDRVDRDRVGPPPVRAAAWGSLDAVKFLLGLGGDPNLRDPTYGGDAIGWAAHHDRHEVVAYLKELAGKKTDS
jgi:ankyrin repeat protein